MLLRNVTNSDVELARSVAASLPRDPRLHRLGYERAVAEVDAAFVAACDLLRNSPPEVAILALRAGPGRYAPDPGWDRPGLLAALGDALEGVAQAGADQVRLVTLAGLVRWAYVGAMPHWGFQDYPFRGGWGTYAARRVWYKLLPPDARGEPAEPPPGWVVEEHFLDGQDWVTVIRQEEPGAPLPEGWEGIDFGEGEVVIFLNNYSVELSVELNVSLGPILLSLEVGRYREQKGCSLCDSPGV